jgi:PncC family amidohydrolase
MSHFQSSLRIIYNSVMAGAHDEPLENLLGELLVRRGLRLAVAESCTGGLISHRITNVPGASEYYLGGVTAYAYQVKERLLDVSRESLERFGAVSQEVAIEMARGVRLRLGADIGASVTGIAGPGGGTPEKPVGLTWIGLSNQAGEWAWRYIWEGDRLQVKEQSAQAVLRTLVEYLRGLEDGIGSG